MRHGGKNEDTDGGIYTKSDKCNNLLILLLTIEGLMYGKVFVY